MQALPINLDIYCESCNSNEYSEHESGFYVCSVCGVLTQVRYGIGLDYADIHKSSMVIRRKVVDEDEDYNNDNNDTMFNTNQNTCANSEYGDSTATRHSKGKSRDQPFKSFNEILMEHQKIFVNLFRSVCYYQYMKTTRNEISFEEFKNYFEENEYFQKLYNSAKIKWKDLVSKELSVQKTQKIRNPSSIGVRKNQRSRRNTEDEKVVLGNYPSNYSTLHPQHTISDRKKRNSIREQLKSRKVKNYNIENIDDLRDRKLKNREKMSLFIEEYDQVKNYLKSHEEVIQKELNISLNEAFNFKYILFIAQKIFNISLKQNSNFEEVIHQIFINSGLNLLSVYKEGDFFDQSKTNLTPDNFLAIFHSIINLNENAPCGSFPTILTGELINVFKSLNLHNLYNNEIKFLKYLNKDKLMKQLDNSIHIGRIRNSLRYIIEEILVLPNFMTQFAYVLYIYSEKFIKSHVNHTYNLENFLIGIVIYLLKVIYGLNDLPYIITLLQNKNKLQNKYYSSIKFYDEIFKIFEDKAEKDKLYEFYKNLPSVPNLIKNLKNYHNKDENSKYLWDLADFKKSLTCDYKEKYIKFSENYLSSIENTFTTNNIYSLEKKINLSFNNYINYMSNNYKVNVKFSKSIMNKREKEEQRVESSENDFHSFIQEELEFYNNLNKKNKKSAVVPFPCDTYVRYHKQAFKFEKVTPPLSELVTLYFFSKLFKVEFKILKKCYKNIEKVVEDKLK